MTHKIIPRAEWGASHGTGWGKRPLPASEAWLHRPAMYGSPDVDATLAQDIAHVRRIEDVGRTRFRDADFDTSGREVWKLPTGSGISYTYVITRAGRIFAGHDPARQSSHTKGHNDVGVGIALADGPSADSPATRQQVEACAWLLQQLVADGILTTPRLDGGHRDTGFPTSCPTAAHAAIPTINSLAGGTMLTYPSRSSIKTNRFYYDLAAVLREEGYQIYDDPTYVDRGFCYPGSKNHNHQSNSRHYARRAVDFGRDAHGMGGESPWEKAYVDAKVRMLRDYYGAALGMVWNRGPGDHRDHGHVDDSAVRQEKITGHTVAGILLYGARGDQVKAWQRNLVAVGRTLEVDGIFGLDTFWATKAWQASRRLVPDAIIGGGSEAAMAKHLVELDPYRVYTPAMIKSAQTLLAKLGYKVGVIDGIPGPKFIGACKAFQKKAKLEVDGLPGPNTMAALRAAVAELEKPAPKPDPKPQPKPSAVPVHRIAGPGRFHTAALASSIALPKGAGVILYVDGTPDAAAAVLLGARTGTRALPVKADGVPAVIARRLSALAPAWVAVVGGPLAFPDTTAQAAAQAAATK